MTLEEAYCRWADDLVAFATTVTGRERAADAVADVFQRLLARPGVWDSVRDQRGYLFRCVNNAARADGRATGRRQRREDAAWASETGRLDRVEDSSSVLIDGSIRVALGALSDQQRAVVFLTYWVDEPVDRVAEILGVRPGTVRRQLARARHRLRGALV